jgi:hypothetical protein
MNDVPRGCHLLVPLLLVRGPMANTGSSLRPPMSMTGTSFTRNVNNNNIFNGGNTHGDVVVLTGACRLGNGSHLHACSFPSVRVKTMQVLILEGWW